MEKMESINDRLCRKYEGAYLDKTWATGGDGHSPRFLSADAVLAMATRLHCMSRLFYIRGLSRRRSLHGHCTDEESGDLPKVSELSSERPSELRCCSELGACLFWEVTEEDNNGQPPTPDIAFICLPFLNVPPRV